MALIKCPACGKELSDVSDFCVHCGYPLAEYKQTLKQLEINNNDNNGAIGDNILPEQEIKVNSKEGIPTYNAPNIGQPNNGTAPQAYVSQNSSKRKGLIIIIVAAAVVLVAAILTVVLLVVSGGSKSVKISDAGWKYTEGKDGKNYSTELYAKPAGNYLLFSNVGTILMQDGQYELESDEEYNDDNKVAIEGGFVLDKKVASKIGAVSGELAVDKTEFESINKTLYTLTIPVTAKKTDPALLCYAVTTDTGLNVTGMGIVCEGKGNVSVTTLDIPGGENPNFEYHFIGGVIFDQKDIPEYQELSKREEDLSTFTYEYADCRFLEPLNGYVVVKRNGDERTPFGVYQVKMGDFSVPLGTSDDKIDTYEIVAFKSSNLKSSYEYIFSGNEEKVERTFEEICDDYNDYLYITHADDYSYILADTNPFDRSDSFDQDTYESIEAINQELGFSSALFTKMGQTRSIDGRQTEENDIVIVTWTYHPDKGLEVMYEKK